MKRKYNLVFVTLLTYLIGLIGFGQTPLINTGSSWDYFDILAEPGNDQSGDNWTDISYSTSEVSGWQEGNAQLGYGDGDEVTEINDQTLTAYFRHSFNVSDQSIFSSINLELTYDDGAVVYLNGTEIWRVNMPTVNISYSTLASTQLQVDNVIISNIVTNTLVNGTNVLAVEVHQGDVGSSDISFDFELTADSGAMSMTRGPYLQKGTTTSVVVKWRTDSNDSSIIEYGINESYSSTFSETTPKTEHELEITGLSPDTKYFYRLGNNGSLLSGNTDLYFTTHPTIGTEQPYTFWVLGDPGTGGDYDEGLWGDDAEDVRDAYYNYIGNNETNAILFLGDNAYPDGTDDEFQRAVFDIYDDKLKNTIAWSCLGNHEGQYNGPVYYDIFTFPTNGESGGVQSNTESYYSFDYGNIHFIVLNSFDENRAVGSTMYNWAENDIQNTNQKWIVAFWHHPPYSKGSHDSDDNGDSGGSLKEMRENFLPMLEDNGIDLVLAGHSHAYERSYLLNGHYGLSGTFNSTTHTFGTNGDGNGKLDGDGAYNKTSFGTDAGKGAVYVVTGSAGKKTGGDLNHPAMYVSLNELGSSVLEVEGENLTVKFLRETGVVEDFFTIEKTSASQTWYQDLDSDTFGNPSVTQDAASQPLGYVANNTDCDDNDADEFPGQTWYIGVDSDSDTFFGSVNSIIACENPGGYTTSAPSTPDCDDTDENVNPGGTEIVDNGIDDDCNPATSDGSADIDADGDGYTVNGAGNLFSDNFNRADSDDLGSDWTHSTGLGSGAAGIVSNTVEDIETGGGTFAIAFRNGVFDDDQWVEATFAGGGVSWSGVALRCDATSSVVWQCSGSVLQMLVVNSGSVKSKGKVNYTVVEGDVIRGEVSGTTYKVFINGNLVHTIVNPSGANTSGNPGIMVEGYAMDNWSGGDTSNNAADCDDSDSAVNPGATEVPYNGVDDDCDPLTLDDDSSGARVALNVPVFIEPDISNGVYPITFTGITISDTNNTDVSATPPSVGEISIGTLYLDNLENYENRIKVYPNPFNDNITIELPLSFNNSEFNIKVFDISGRLVFDKKYLSSNGIINVTEMKSLEQTLYLMKITSLKARNSISKLLIKY